MSRAGFRSIEEAFINREVTLVSSKAKRPQCNVLSHHREIVAARETYIQAGRQTQTYGRTDENTYINEPIYSEGQKVTGR